MPKGIYKRKTALEKQIEEMERERKDKECSCQDYRDACSKCGGDKF
jgi:hypothetical protein